MALKTKVRGSGGGPVCKFRVGRAGTSADQMRYLSRPSAVKEREAGVLLHQMPQRVEEAHSYGELRQNLISYAATRDLLEQIKHQSRGDARSHYRAVLSFERPIESTQAKALAQQWLNACFPAARAAGFLHRDTANVHVHLFIEARQIDGTKLNLTRQEFRQLDEQWNKLYCQALGKDEREHLEKKARPFCEKQKARLEAKLLRDIPEDRAPNERGETPERATDLRLKSREVERPKMKYRYEHTAEREETPSNQSAVAGGERQASERALGLPGTEPGAYRPGAASSSGEHALARLDRESKRAVSEALQLHRDATHLACDKRDVEIVPVRIQEPPYPEVVRDREDRERL